MCAESRHLESCFLPLDKSRPWGASWRVRNSEAGEGCRSQPAKGKPGLQGEDMTGWGVGTVRGGRRVLPTDAHHLKLHPLPSFPPLLSSLKACAPPRTQAVKENQVKESPPFPDFPRQGCICFFLSLPSPQMDRDILFFFLSVWLHRVLVAARRILTLHCGMLYL